MTSPSDVEPAAHAEAQRWLRYARDDLHLAGRLLVDPDFSPRLACYHAQQAAEKALKAALVRGGVDFPKTHDLDLLRNRLPDGWRVKAAHPRLNSLTVMVFEARYPGDWDDPTAADALDAVTLARAVLESIAGDPKLRPPAAGGGSESGDQGTSRPAG